MANVIIEDLSKIYKDDKGTTVVAVDQINLAIEDQEFVVLVGPSGCGKSTTLRMVAGLEEISKGTISIAGRRVNDVPPKDRDIAMVFQNYALYPHMTVYKNMAFGLQLRGRPKAEIDQRVREAAQILGFTDEMLQRKPKALSGGQRQRVALGRAIVRKPSVFLFDEPLSNLDAKMRVQMRAEISKLHLRLASTMIYVTHDQVEAMTMGDRIVVMKSGRIQQAAEPLEVYSRPSNMYVAAFIGSPGMNFFEGTVIESQGQLYFLERTANLEVPALRLRLHDTQAKFMAAYRDKDIVLGLRPEYLETPKADDRPDPAQTFTATLDMSEPMGAETHLYLKTGAHTFIARQQGLLYEKTGHRMTLVANMEKALFFTCKPKADFLSADTSEFDHDAWLVANHRIV